MIRAKNSGYAAIVPIGPGAVEVRRFHDLLDSLFAYEPEARLCVTIDSARRARRVAPRGNRSRGCQFVTLRAPYQDQGEPLMGRLSAGILLALRTVQQTGRFEFVLRMDTDALAIGRFQDAIRALLAAHPEVGMLGTLGCTCRREAWYYGCERTATSDVFKALDTVPAGHSAFARIREHARLAVENGYAGKEYCQGGAYALSPAMLTRLSSMGCLDRPEDWLPLAVPEDVMMGMYARTVGLRSVDCSLPGQPFGNHFGGLAYRPGELVERGYALIHSVKRDLEHSESEIRRYFRARRRALDGRHRTFMPTGA
ncbi:MAG: hypothetical protein ABSF64_22080 [Bryobacteraceae bacterium]